MSSATDAPSAAGSTKTSATMAAYWRSARAAWRRSIHSTMAGVIPKQAAQPNNDQR